MSRFLTVACLILAVGSVTAHVCVLNPPQRGGLSGINLNKEASGGCILLNSPCGGKDKHTPDTDWKSGSNVTVIFQKNLDHYNKSTPGYFSVSLLSDSLPKELVRIPDKGEPSLSIYNPSFLVPTLLNGNGQAILQVTYVTKNPAAPPIFYQCSDVNIY